MDTVQQNMSKTLKNELTFHSVLIRENRGNIETRIICALIIAGADVMLII